MASILRGCLNINWALCVNKTRGERVVRNCRVTRARAEFVDGLIRAGQRFFMVLNGWVLKEVFGSGSVRLGQQIFQILNERVLKVPFGSVSFWAGH